jgi:hypothetical protein
VVQLPLAFRRLRAGLPGGYCRNVPHWFAYVRCPHVLSSWVWSQHFPQKLSKTDRESCGHR